MARQLEQADVWGIVFYRAVGLLVGTTLLCAIRYRTRFFFILSNNAPKMITAGLFQGLSSALFVLAVTNTSIANAMLVLSSVPLFGAILGWLILRERVDRPTMIAICTVMVGISTIAWDGIVTGTIVGNFAAFGNALSFAFFVIFMRRAGNIDLLPIVMCGAMIAALIGAVNLSTFRILPHDLAVCLIWGGLIQCAGLYFVTRGARSLLTAEISLLSLSEFILGPVWAWVAVGEVPNVRSIVGGGLIVLTVALWSAIGVSKTKTADNQLPR